eukprot:361181-Chlamydomonas_euryale.AAC.7
MPLPRALYDRSREGPRTDAAPQRRPRAPAPHRSRGRACALGCRAGQTPPCLCLVFLPGTHEMGLNDTVEGVGAGVAASVRRRPAVPARSARAVRSRRWRSSGGGRATASGRRSGAAGKGWRRARRQPSRPHRSDHPPPHPRLVLDRRPA